MRGLGEYPKKIRAEFRELVGKANERELSQALEALEVHFERWREGEISAFELNDLIHAHHHGASREIWKLYDGCNPELLVARAVARGLLRSDELSTAMAEIVEPRVRFFHEVPDEDVDEPDEV